MATNSSTKATLALLRRAGRAPPQQAAVGGHAEDDALGRADGAAAPLAARLVLARHDRVRVQLRELAKVDALAEERWREHASGERRGEPQATAGPWPGDQRC